MALSWTDTYHMLRRVDSIFASTTPNVVGIESLRILMVASQDRVTGMVYSVL